MARRRIRLRNWQNHRETGFKRKTGLKNGSIPYKNYLVPLALLLPLVVFVLPGFLRCNAELGDDGSVGVLDSCVLNEMAEDG